MAEPTLTRQELRRSLARELRMDFARRYGASTLTFVTNTSNVTDTKLTQATDFWKNQFLFIYSGNAAGNVRRITASTSGGALTLEYSLGAVPSIGDGYEIHAIWSADDLHQALNRSIRDSFPAFFDVVLDESIVLSQDQLEFDLTALATLPFRIKQVYREVNIGQVLRGTATSGTTTYLADTALIGRLTGIVTSNWKIGIYYGTGKGQLRSVASIVDATGRVLPSAVWTTTPDTTSRYTLWDPTVQRKEWDRVMAARFDNFDWPSTLYLYRVPAYEWGMRLRLKYLARCTQLAAETDTTVLPEAYLLSDAQAMLYGQMVNDSRADRQRYAALSQEHAKAAMDFKASRAFREPAGTLWQDEEMGGRYFDSANPMGW